jgi:hypothetical protein
MGTAGRWQRYWFADGGRVALAIVRIAVATAVLIALARLAHTRSPVASPAYRPIGIWMLLGHTPPPAALVSILWVVAWASTGAMLLGLATRATTALSFISAVALASLSFSASASWSHQYNVVFLAQLALLGSRSGDALSIDARIHPHDVPRAYQWSLRLVQLAVVLMFAGAAFHKLLHGHFTLRWALSDNLRHHLLVRFDLAGLERPAIVDWLLAESWRYRTAALLNMLTQATPLVAVFAINRPLVRAAAGVMFVVETLLLGVVVDLWNPAWLPLFAVFVDWDALIARVRRRPATVPPAPESWRAPRGVRAFIAVFVVYDVVTAFVPALDQRLNTYPFSGFPMFATIRVREPYDEHLPYSITAGSFEVTSEVPIEPRGQRWLDHQHRTLYTVRDAGELNKRLAHVLERMQYYWPAWRVHGIKLWLTVYEAPAYPAPAELVPHRIAVIGEITPDGRFRSMLGKLRDGVLIVRPQGVELATDARLVYYRDDLPTPEPIAAPRDGIQFALRRQPLPGNPRYFVVESDGVPWLAASMSEWEWR